MNLLFGHRYATSFYGDSARLKLAQRELPELPADGFDRYENPFEMKWTWKRKDRFPTQLEKIVEDLEERVTAVSAMVGYPLLVDRSRHYCGLFRYEIGDHLSVHVDAGLQPVSHLRKHVTAVLYLSEGAPLELWAGDSAGEKEPQLVRKAATIPAFSGGLVIFENTDYAWHGVGVETEGARWVLTVSYLSNAVDAFANKRERAFFVPRPDEVADWRYRGLYAWRDRRADPDHYAEAYRS